MKPYGLTGNIGCGKSTVASLLEHHKDVLIVNCDQIAKEIIAGNELRSKINFILGVNAFPNGEVDLGVITKVIFSNPSRKKEFENLIHPLVWDEVNRWVKYAEIKSEVIQTNILCIVESAIIYETNTEDKFEVIIVVTCNPDEQFRRLQKDRNMTAEQIRACIASQIPSTEKIAKAQFVIETDCTLGELENRVTKLYEKLKQRKEAKT